MIHHHHHEPSAVDCDGPGATVNTTCTSRFLLLAQAVDKRPGNGRVEFEADPTELEVAASEVILTFNLK
jgi:hypothetical protein